MDLLEAADKALERLKEMSDDDLLVALENSDDSISYAKWNFVDNG